MEDIHNPLDDCKIAQLTALDETYTKDLAFDVEYNGVTYQGDEASYAKMLYALMQTELPSGFYWVSKSNDQVPFTKAQLAGLADLVFQRRFALFDQLQRRKHIVRNATAIEQLFNLPA